MNALESHKKLLIAESELNRAQLAEDWQAMTGEVHALTHKAKTIGSLASAATLVASLVFLRRKQSAPAGEKSSWWQAALKGAGMAASLWRMFRTPPKS
jgi:hypothetical protein